MRRVTFAYVIRRKRTTSSSSFSAPRTSHELHQRLPRQEFVSMGDPFLSLVRPQSPITASIIGSFHNPTKPFSLAATVSACHLSPCARITSVVQQVATGLERAAAENVSGARIFQKQSTRATILVSIQPLKSRRLLHMAVYLAKFSQFATTPQATKNDTRKLVILSFYGFIAGLVRGWDDPHNVQCPAH